MFGSACTRYEFYTYTYSCVFRSSKSLFTRAHLALHSHKHFSFFATSSDVGVGWGWMNSLFRYTHYAWKIRKYESLFNLVAVRLCQCSLTKSQWRCPRCESEVFNVRWRSRQVWDRKIVEHFCPWFDRCCVSSERRPPNIFFPSALKIALATFHSRE